MKYFVIGYDISDPARLQRIHRLMCKFAIPLEYSVFLLIGSVSDKNKCLADVAAVMDMSMDDVRCYALPVRGLQQRIGRSGLPDGIQWTGLPAGWHSFPERCV